MKENILKVVENLFNNIFTLIDLKSGIILNYNNRNYELYSKSSSSFRSIILDILDVATEYSLYEILNGFENDVDTYNFKKLIEIYE